MAKLLKKTHTKEVRLELMRESSGLFDDRTEIELFKRLEKYKSIEIIRRVNNKHISLYVNMEKFKQYSTSNILKGLSNIKLEQEIDMYGYKFELVIKSEKPFSILRYLEKNIAPSRTIRVISKNKNSTKISIELYRETKDIEDYLNDEIERKLEYVTENLDELYPE